MSDQPENLNDQEPKHRDEEHQVMLEAIQSAYTYPRLMKAIEEYLTAVQKETSEQEVAPTFGQVDSSEPLSATVVTQSISSFIERMEAKWKETRNLALVINFDLIKDENAREVISGKVADMLRKSKTKKLIQELFSTEETFQHNLKAFITEAKEIIEKEKKKSTLYELDLSALKEFTDIARAIVGLQEMILDPKLDIVKENVKLIALFKALIAHFTTISQNCDLKKYERLNFKIKGIALDSASIFIMPIQRMPRWRMLLEQILELKEGEKDQLSSVERIAFTKLLAATQTSGHQMNEAIRQTGDFSDNVKKLSSGSITEKIQLIKKLIIEGGLDKYKESITPELIAQISNNKESKIKLDVPGDITSERAAKQLSDYIESGFEIKFKSEDIKKLWSEKIGKTPIIISGPLESSAPVKTAIKNGLMLAKNEFPVSVSTSFFSACKTQSGSILGGGDASLFMTKMHGKIIPDGDIKRKRTEEVRNEAEAKIIAGREKTAAAEQAKAAADKVKIETENKAQREVHGVAFGQIRKVEGSPKKAKHIAAIDNLKNAIKENKLKEITPEKLAKTVALLLKDYPEGFVVTLDTPQNMSGEQAAQQLSDYISCGFKFIETDKEKVKEWALKMIDAGTETRHAINITASPESASELIERIAETINFLYANGFKIFQVSDAFYNHLIEMSTNSREIETLLINGLFVKDKLLKFPPQPDEALAETQADLSEALPPKVMRRSSIKEPYVPTAEPLPAAPEVAAPPESLTPPLSAQEPLPLPENEPLILAATSQMPAQNDQRSLSDLVPERSKKPLTFLKNSQVSYETRINGELKILYKCQHQIRKNRFIPLDNNYFDFESIMESSKKLEKALKVAKKSPDKLEEVPELVKKFKEDFEGLKLPQRETERLNKIENFLKKIEKYKENIGNNKNDIINMLGLGKIKQRNAEAGALENALNLVKESPLNIDVALDQMKRIQENIKSWRLLGSESRLQKIVNEAINELEATQKLKESYHKTKYGNNKR